MIDNHLDRYNDEINFILWIMLAGWCRLIRTVMALKRIRYFLHLAIGLVMSSHLMGMPTPTRFIGRFILPIVRTVILRLARPTLFLQKSPDFRTHFDHLAHYQPIYHYHLEWIRLHPIRPIQPIRIALFLIVHPHCRMIHPIMIHLLLEFDLIKRPIIFLSFLPHFVHLEFHSFIVQ
jgi:hypothetical protein